MATKKELENKILIIEKRLEENSEHTNRALINVGATLDNIETRINGDIIPDDLLARELGRRGFVECQYGFIKGGEDPGNIFKLSTEQHRQVVNDINVCGNAYLRIGEGRKITRLDPVNVTISIPKPHGKKRSNK